jgi:argininosuccinate lyase
MRDSASKGMMNATELADYLVRKGMPFREAHETVGRIVVQAIERGIELQELLLDEIRSISALINKDVFDALSLEKTLETKGQIGGTSPGRVSDALAAARKSLMS